MACAPSIETRLDRRSDSFWQTRSPASNTSAGSARGPISFNSSQFARSMSAAPARAQYEFFALPLTVLRPLSRRRRALVMNLIHDAPPAYRHTAKRMSALPAPTHATFDMVEQVRRLVDRSPLPTVATEGEPHVVRYVNPAFSWLVGQSAEGLVGNPVESALSHGPQTNLQAALALLDLVYGTGTAEFGLDLAGMFGNASAIHLPCAVWPILGGDERPMGLLIQVSAQAGEPAEPRRYVRRVAGRQQATRAGRPEGPGAGRGRGHAQRSGRGRTQRARRVHVHRSARITHARDGNQGRRAAGAAQTGGRPARWRADRSVSARHRAWRQPPGVAHQ